MPLLPFLTAAADLYKRLEQRGKLALNERNVCVQRAGVARDASGGRSRCAFLLHGLCLAVCHNE